MCAGIHDARRDQRLDGGGMNKHKHYDLIVAWAGGATIEVFANGIWETLDGPGMRGSCQPQWLDDYQYRIKPKTPLEIAIAALTMIGDNSVEDNIVTYTLDALRLIKEAS